MVKRKKQEGISVRDIYEFISDRWSWFLLSVLICTGGMFLYLKMQQPTFYRTATVLIQDDKSTRADAFILTIKSEENNDLANKMKILTSGRLMRKVVDQLNLDVLYHSETLLRKQDRYDNTPVTAMFIDEYSNYIDFSVVPLNNTKYKIGRASCRERVYGLV